MGITEKKGFGRLDDFEKPDGVDGFRLNDSGTDVLYLCFCDQTVPVPYCT